MAIPPGPDPERPSLNGKGPAECSSSKELSVVPYIIWDVNGYYRDLGVSPWATRTQLRKAYQRQNGDTSTRLTYVVKQLVNKEIRRAYDLMPFGEPFMDQYVQDLIRAEMIRRKWERMANLRDLGVDVERLDEAALERDIYAELGVFGLDDPTDEEDEDSPSETVDPEPEQVQDEHRPADPFPFSYYLWKTGSIWSSSELVVLSEWQRFLVSALSREGIRIKFSVGYHGHPHVWLFAMVGYRPVFLLNRDAEPNEEFAADAVSSFRESLATRERSLAAV